MAFSFTPQQQQQSSLFQTPQQQQSSLFQTPQSSPFSLFSQTPQPQQQQQQSPLLSQVPQLQQQPQQSPFQLQPQQQQTLAPQLYLFTTDKTPATYSTKWADLHPDSQKVLLQIEERVLEYKDESQRLDQCSRLYDSSVFNGGFEQDASRICQELGGISTAMEKQRAICQDLMATAKDILRNTEVAVRSFMMLRPRFLHSGLSVPPSATTPSQGSGAIIAQSSATQPAASSVVPVFDFYSGVPRKPSPFLQETVARFEKYIAECHQWIEELEQLILLDSDRNSLNSTSSLLNSLPKVMANVHDFFVHVAAKVESIHQYIESMKTAYLADQRHQGTGNDPFLEADRRETAKQEAAAKRIHPTLHLPALPQPATQVAGLLPSSAMPGVSTASRAAPPASSGSGFSLLATPAASSSLFSTPTILGALPPQSSIFGSTPATTPAVAGSVSLFAPTPDSGGSTFATPFATGAATGSGASFNTAGKARAKSRTGRR